MNRFFLADGDYELEKWQTRNRRLWSRSMGVKVKEPDENLNRSEDTLDSVFDTASHSVRRTPHPVDPLARRHGRTSSQRPSAGYGRQYSRQVRDNVLLARGERWWQGK